MSFEDLKTQIISLLQTNSDLAYNMDELAEHFGNNKSDIQKAVSQLDDENKVRLRVYQKKVYVHIPRGEKN